MIFNSRSGRGKWVSQTRSEKIYMQNNPQVCTFIESNSAAREIKNNDNIKSMQSTRLNNSFICQGLIAEEEEFLRLTLILY